VTKIVIRHAIRSAISENPQYAHSIHTALCVKEAEFLPIEVIAGIGILYFIVPLTLTLTRWPSYTNFTRYPSR